MTSPRAKQPTSVGRGFTLIEVLAAMVITILGTSALVAGLVAALGANSIANRRTQMLEFAQSRMDKLVTDSRSGPYAIRSLGTAGTFDPNVQLAAAPGSGMWVTDTSITALPPSGDPMAGPILALTQDGKDLTDVTGTKSGIDMATTATLRSAFLSASKSCGDVTVARGNILCREIHLALEPPGVTGGPSTNMWHAWIRVTQGGAKWASNQVVLEKWFAQ